MKKENLKTGDRLREIYQEHLVTRKSRQVVDFVIPYMTKLEIEQFIDRKCYAQKLKYLDSYISRICKFRDYWMNRKFKLAEGEELEDLYFNLKHNLGHLTLENFNKKIIEQNRLSEYGILEIDEILAGIYEQLRRCGKIGIETIAPLAVKIIEAHKIQKTKKEVEKQREARRNARWVEEDNQLYYSKEVIKKILSRGRSILEEEAKKPTQSEEITRSKLNRHGDLNGDTPFYNNTDYGQLAIPNYSCELRNYYTDPKPIWNGLVTFEIY